MKNIIKNTWTLFLLVCFFPLLKMQATIKNPEQVKNEFEALRKNLKEEDKYTYAPKRMLIILDDSETHLGAAHQTLFIALGQNAGPLVVSTSLLAKVLEELNDVTLNPQASDIPGEYGRLHFQKENERYRIGRKILLKASGFTPSKWVIKKIDDFLTLLIPNDYLNSLPINISAVKTVNKNTISLTEQKLGLQVNHMETIEDISQISLPKSVPEYADYFINALSNIFCTRSAYHHNPNLPLWAFYIIGHGLMNNSIVGLRLNDFVKVLDFLEQKLNTRLVMYTSCYGAGANTETIYKTNGDVLQKTYPFTIITQVYADTPAAAPLLSVKFEEGELQLDTLLDFKKTLEEITKEATINYEEAVKHVFPIVPEVRATKTMQATTEVSTKIEWENVPQIKLPGAAWFSVMATRTEKPIEMGDKPEKKPADFYTRPEMVSIQSTLAKTRDPNNPLDIVNFFKTDPKVILLYAQDIPFELKVGKNLMAIVSMIPGDATHTIKKISSGQMQVSTILDSFMRLKMLDPKKIFFIEEITGQSKTGPSDVVVHNKKILAQYKGQPDEYQVYAIGKQSNGNLFIQEPNKVRASDTEQNLKNTYGEKIDFYNQFIAKQKGGLISLGSFTADEDLKLMLSPNLERISSASIIEEIKPANTDLYTRIFNIISYVQHKQNDNTFVWIKRLTGAADNLDLGTTENLISAINKFRHDKITITDVVIDKSNKLIFLTYNNKFYQYNLQFKNKQEMSDSYINNYQSGKTAKKTAAATPYSLLPSTITQEELKSIKSKISLKTAPPAIPLPEKNPSTLQDSSADQKLKMLPACGGASSFLVKYISKWGGVNFDPKLEDTIDSSCSIEEIRTKETRPSDKIMNIINTIFGTLSKNTFVWVKKITGASTDLSLPKTSWVSISSSEMAGERITITNVIIDKTKEVFFTYKDKFYRCDANFNEAPKETSENYMHTYLGGGAAKKESPFSKELIELKKHLAGLKDVLSKLAQKLADLKKAL